MKLGFIGLGNMGLPMAERLLAAGHDLVVHDLNSEAVASLTAQGARAADSPQAVADATETVLASLPTPQIVQAVALGENGVIAGKAVKRFIDLSTSGAPTAKLLAAKLGDAGVAAIDSPVSGGVSGAAAGTLAMMVACSAAEFVVVEPIVAHLGKVFHVGAEPGLGQSMKLLNNYLSATALATTSEALVFGAKAGLDPQTMIDILNVSSGRNSATQDKFPRSILTGKFDFGFAAGLMCKDLRLFAEQADNMGVPLWVGSAVRQLWQYTSDQLGPGTDFTSIIKPMEEWAQVQVRSAEST